VRTVDAMTADALATVAGVLAWDEAARLVDLIPDAAALAVRAGGVVGSAGRFGSAGRW
jgi:thiamine biosynthesis lipoprotein ApbE